MCYSLSLLICLCSAVSSAQCCLSCWRRTVVGFSLLYIRRLTHCFFLARFCYFSNHTSFVLVAYQHEKNYCKGPTRDCLVDTWGEFCNYSVWLIVKDSTETTLHVSCVLLGSRSLPRTLGTEHAFVSHNTTREFIIFCVFHNPPMCMLIPALQRVVNLGNVLCHWA